MSAMGQDKLSDAVPAVVLERAKLPDVARNLVARLTAVADMVTALAQAGFGIEATRILSHALPKREAVWWACMCALHTAPADLTEADRKVRELAESWVRQQNMEAARAAMAEARRTGFQSPEAWAGVGAFWSGESLAPPEVPAVTPPPHLTGVAVAGAVALASVRGDAARQPLRLAMFLQSAHDIASGGAGRLPMETA